MFDTNLEIDAIGNYSVDGHNPWDEESKYSGSLQIQKNDNQYHLDWAVGISNIYQKGIGKVIKNFLVVHFDYKDKEHTFKGLVIYRQIDKDTLAGFWIEEGIFEVGFECLKLKNRGFQ
ncbi:hypothetical protein NH26_18265 [Flammeovirga pacifica]|uniref:Uncharacterized protein n=1 Tax=Flammeovirga pacifica TaxID=915059 RepID=A0A1S1Z614_FLAPC|nr:hypothetical protein NH26_18265 [Flammeovirga pacifica]